MIQPTRIKICGITREVDAQAAASLGVDALGFVFVRASARYIEPEAAAAIADRLPPFVTPVGLFLDAEPRDIEAAIAAIPTLMPQFHGRESAADCQRWGRAYLKAIGLDGVTRTQLTEQLEAHHGASALLFDSHAPGALGGTGHAFDWTRLAGELPAERPWILAGGLDAGNVGAALGQVRPWAVDVSSGVEQSKGIKDHDRLADFVGAVRSSDRHRMIEDAA